MVFLLLLLSVLHFAAISVAQSCQNDGFQNGTTCACPPGFGGGNCSQPTCGGDIFQGVHRKLVPLPTVSSTFPNITASGCTCESGWTGTGCNVCQNSNVCQSGYAASGNISTGTSGLGDTQNNTLVCSTKPQVYAASHMSCQVIVCSLAFNRNKTYSLAN